jgi:hypothetical protein
MGLYISKADASFGMVKSRTHDDDRSKATTRTEDSSVLVRNPKSGAHPQFGTALPAVMQHPQTWRGGCPRSAPVLTQARRRSRSSESIGSNFAPSLSRRDSDPGAPTKPTKPVKCPPSRRRLSGLGNDRSVEHLSDAEDSKYLVRMYDTRTWEMYIRITEARKNSQFPSDEEHPSIHAKPNQTYCENKGETTSGWENLQHECSDSDDGHAMIFLFDFD